MNEKSVRIAIVGMGYWGPNFARLSFEVDGVELVACCDLDKGVLGKIKKRYPAVIAISDYHLIAEDATIDGVIVVTPPETHYKICKELLINGKHVLVEKPLTLNPKDAKELIDLAKKNKKILMVDHIFKYNSAITKLREIIVKKTLGDIFYVSGSYTALGPVRSDVNALLDLAPHHFYMINYVLDKMPIWISTFGNSFLKEGTSDVAFITIAYPNNILAKVHVSWLYPFKVRDLVVIGKEKMAVFDDASQDEKLKIYDKSAFYDETYPEYPAILKILYREGDIVVPKLEPKEPLREVLITFRDCVLSGKKPKSDGEDGRIVVKMLVAAQESLDNDGRKVSLE